MNVWVIGRDYPTIINQMAGSFELEQAKMLAKHGLDVCYPILDLRGIHRWRKFGFHCALEDGVKLSRLDIPLLLAFCSQETRRKAFQYFWAKLFSLTAKKYGAPDIIHIHYPSLSNRSLIDAIHKLGAKIVLTEHYTKVQNKTLTETDLDNLQAFTAHSDKFFCVGELLRNSVCELTNTEKTIDVLPNIVPPFFSYCENESGGSADVFRFVAAGRLVECKRFDLLISAFSKAFSNNKKVELHIIGGGEQENTLRTQRAGSPCADRIYLHGTMDRKKIAAFFKQCHSLVLSSNLETFGVPVIEAFASGMPVVTSDSFGLLSYINKNNGIVFKTDNEEQLSNAMLEMYDNYAHYDRQHIANEAVATFGEDEISKRLIEAYYSLVKE